MSTLLRRIGVIFMGKNNRADPKCWICAVSNDPPELYGPNICSECTPLWKSRVYVFNRPPQSEMEALFVDRKGMTCMS